MNIQYIYKIENNMYNYISHITFKVKLGLNCVFYLYIVSKLNSFRVFSLTYNKSVLDLFTG